jgi:hypothetical protein
MALHKVAHLTGLTPFELAYQRQKRGGEQQRTLFSRTQWAAKGRRVVVQNSEGRAIVTRAGHMLHLFSEIQTEQI